jgi:hypothetical protein
MTVYGNTYDFWHDIGRMSRQTDWIGIRRAFQENPSCETAPHMFTDEVFDRAAAGGQVDILQEMIKRRYKLYKDEDIDRGSELVARLAQYHADTAMPAIAFLVRGGHADPDSALCKIAAVGNLDLMRKMEDAGCHPLNGNTSFFLSFFNGHAGMMEYLYDRGANLYHSGVIAGIYKRRGELSDQSLAGYENVLDRETQKYTALYEKHVLYTDTLDGYRRTVQGGETLMQVAARAGYFSHVVEVALGNGSSGGVTVDDLYAPSEGGVCVMSVLAARQELSSVFDPRLWAKDPADLQEAFNKLETINAAGAVDITPVLSEITRLRLQEQKPKRKFVLKGP